MRIIIITQGISKIVYPLLESNHEIIGIIESAPRQEQKKFKKNMWPTLIRIYNLFKSDPASLKYLAKKKGIPYYYFTKSDKGIKSWLKQKNPDLIVVHSMSQLLKKEIIDMPKYGAINLHPTYLPDYRGPNPFFWMYYDQVLNPGVTIHFIDQGEDTGDIIYQEKYKISIGENLLSCQEKMYIIGIKLLLKSIEDISNEKYSTKKQPKLSPTVRARNIIPEEYLTLINWNEWDVERIYHFLKGTPKYAFCLKNMIGIKNVNEIKIIGFDKICSVKISPGQVLHRNNTYYIICRNGRIIISTELKV